MSDHAESSQNRCEKTHPPGELVYKRGAHAIREIDGAKQKVRRCLHYAQALHLTYNPQLYCQFLSLFGKLFIDVKTLFFDTDNCTYLPFNLCTTATDPCFCSHVLCCDKGDNAQRRASGILLKGKTPPFVLSSPSAHVIPQEKHSFDDYNLACITTFPQHQKQAFGMLMIEFSYELSRRANKIGTPERPLSDLGLRSYLAYWVATIIRFFR